MSDSLETSQVAQRGNGHLKHGLHLFLGNLHLGGVWGGRLLLPCLGNWVKHPIRGAIGRVPRRTEVTDVQIMCGCRGAIALRRQRREL